MFVEIGLSGRIQDLIEVFGPLAQVAAFDIDVAEEIVQVRKYIDEAFSKFELTDQGHRIILAVRGICHIFGHSSKAPPVLNHRHLCYFRGKDTAFF